jgi:Domain of unknown function (DUF4276)
MKAEHLEILVEERSMEVFLRGLLPRLIGDQATFNVYPSQGKEDLLRNLPARLKGYASWLPKNWRVVVVVDRDDQDCHGLKKIMEQAAAKVGLRTRKGKAHAAWQVVNRIAIEELEAWYFGDWDAVREIYTKVPKTIPEKAAYRDPDNVDGGTCEAFERVLQRAGYFESGLRKTEVARSLGKRVVPTRNRSHSFGAFRDALLEAVQ